MCLAAPTIVVAVNAHQLLDRDQMDVLSASNQLRPLYVQLQTSEHPNSGVGRIADAPEGLLDRPTETLPTVS
jgi:hypothetical protein